MKWYCGTAVLPLLFCFLWNTSYQHFEVEVFVVSTFKLVKEMFHYVKKKKYVGVLVYTYSLDNLMRVFAVNRCV